eukprot:473368-Rhodomonas_salina.6
MSESGSGSRLFRFRQFQNEARPRRNKNDFIHEQSLADVTHQTHCAAAQPALQGTRLQGSRSQTSQSSPASCGTAFSFFCWRATTTAAPSTATKNTQLPSTELGMGG